MKTRLIVILALLAPLGLFAADAATDSSQPAAKEKSGPTRHPLKGMVVDVVADKGALLVKHDEIPGIMRAMTMLLKVTPEDLKSVHKDQPITGLLVRKPDGWWLESVKPAQN